MKLRYTLIGTGWSETVIEFDEGTVTVTASYLDDALGGMARSAVSVLRGCLETRFTFAEEPGEYRWIVKRQEADSYLLTILEFSELWSNKPDETGKVLLQRPVMRTTFAKMVLKALEDVRFQYGIEGYKEKWVAHDFPREELSALRALLASEEARP